ncbi:MAG: ABC transporter ATP-binding protein [Clostridia bacterium]|nr:ABC transporter ATP-binding protein [Clostridia bacterium]
MNRSFSGARRNGGGRLPSRERHSPWRIFGNVTFLFRYLLRYAPVSVALTFLNSVLGAALRVVGNVIFVNYIFDAIENRHPFTEIATLAALLVLLHLVLNFATARIWFVYILRANHKLHAGMQGELYLKARALDQACYDDPEFYNDFIWAIRESDKRAASLRQDCGLLLRHILTIVGTTGVLLTIDPFVGLIVLLFVPLGFFLKILSNRIRLNKQEELNPINRRMGYVSRVFYLKNHAKELRHGDVASLLRRDYEEQNEKQMAVHKKYRGKLFWVALISDFLAYLLFDMVVTCYLVVRYVRDSGFSLGNFSAGLNAMFSIYSNANMIVGRLTNFNEHSIYIEKFRRFIAYEPKVVSGEETEVPSFESLTLQDVSFSYGEGEARRDVLKHVDLTIRRGEKIAFVGYNGAGKTTLTKLLMRLYDPTEGAVLYNGRDLRDFDIEAYRNRIGAVFQDYKVFAATVAENVLGGPFTPDREEDVRAALHAAAFDEKLAALPNGIHTQLTREFDEAGTELSGGETQKIAIARVFARDFDVIIMDEPSSALDPIAEYELNQSVMEDAGHKTVIFISHRLSTTRMADRIYMFADGEIVEVGSHDELMARDGRYAQMFRVQAKKYESHANETE